MTFILFFISSLIFYLFLWMQLINLTFAKYCLPWMAVISSISIAVCIELVLPVSLCVGIDLIFDLPFSYALITFSCCSHSRLLSFLQISPRPCWMLSWKHSASDVILLFDAGPWTASDPFPIGNRTQSCSLEEELSRESPGIAQRGEAAQVLIYGW